MIVDRFLMIIYAFFRKVIRFQQRLLETKEQSNVRKT